MRSPCSPANSQPDGNFNRSAQWAWPRIQHSEPVAGPGRFSPNERDQVAQDEELKRRVEDSPLKRTSPGFRTGFTILIVVLLVAILLLATGVIKMNQLGGP
jgi:hypothetical protein